MARSSIPSPCGRSGRTGALPRWGRNDPTRCINDVGVYFAADGGYFAFIARHPLDEAVVADLIVERGVIDRLDASCPGRADC